MKRKVTPALLAVYLFMLAAGSAYARHPKVARDLEGEPSNAIVDVIVQFKGIPGTATRQRLSARGGRLKRDLRDLKSGAYSQALDDPRS